MRIDRELSVTDTPGEALSKVPLFAHLSARQLKKLSKRVIEDHYEEGTVIVRQGGLTDTMFVILEGTARIDRDGRTIARRSVGEFFGEIAVIDGRPRSGTVIAETPLRCLVFFRRELKEMVMSEPRAAWSMLESLASRVREK
jgi:CRP/FNR family transcriptional regulator, cyclic AMP receptor protein